MEVKICTPNRIRTCDLRIRSALLYPAELPGQKNGNKRREIKLINSDRITRKIHLFLSSIPPRENSCFLRPLNRTLTVENYHLV